MLAIASCWRSPSSSTRVAEGRLRSSKWSGHSSSMLQQALEIGLVVLRFVDDQFALFRRRGVGILRLRLLPRADRGLVSTSSSASFSCISCSIRSCSAMIGNCRISIDWIMRGASTCFCTIRISWPKESRMGVT